MQRVKTGRHLHGLHIVDRIPVREDNPRFLKQRTAVREFVFDHQVFADLCVYEGGGIGVFGGNDYIHIANPLLQQRGLDGL
ncbi:hypothetical protein D3C73_766820 [compost metagenome]